jgi:hypothetical protein
MMDAKSAQARVRPGWIGSCDCEACNRSRRSIAREFLQVQAETLEECERHFSLQAGALYQSWLVTTRAELKKLETEHA